MKHIKKVRIFNSDINVHKGEDIGPGFAVIIDPPADTDHKKWQVAQAITDKLEGMKLEDE